VTVVGQVQDVVIKTVLFVPKIDALATPVVHGVRDIHEVFEELAGHVGVSAVFLG
jgi:hypothetical protein